MTDPSPLDVVVTRVSTLAAATSRPTLTDAEVLASVQAYPLPDVDGLFPGDDDWTPTYDTNAVVAELWGIKAARVAGDFNFSADDGTYSKGDVMAKCLEMQATFAAKAVGSAPTGAWANDDPLRGVIVNG